MAIATRVRYGLREMTHGDLRRVQQIERAAFSDAWPRTTFEGELRNRLARYLVAVERPGQSAAEVARPRLTAPLRRLQRSASGEKVVGYSGVWYTLDQLHLVSVAVDLPQQGRGVGQWLLIACFALAARAELTTIALEVRPSNEGAIRLYERYGFTHAGRQRNYYADNGEDALVMVTPSIDGAAMREHVDRLRAAHQARYGDAFAYDGPNEDALSPPAAGEDAPASNGRARSRTK